MGGPRSVLAYLLPSHNWKHKKIKTKREKGMEWGGRINFGLSSSLMHKMRVKEHEDRKREMCQLRPWFRLSHVLFFFWLPTAMSSALHISFPQLPIHVTWFESRILAHAFKKELFYYIGPFQLKLNLTFKKKSAAATQHAIAANWFELNDGWTKRILLSGL